MFFKVFSVFLAVFNVVFSSFLSVSQKKKKKKKKKKKRSGFFAHPRYTLLGII